MLYVIFLNLSRELLLENRLGQGKNKTSLENLLLSESKAVSKDQ